MRLRIPAVLFAVITVFFCTVCAGAVSGDNYSIDLKNFTVAKANDNLTDIADVLGMEKQDVDKFVEENGVLFLAADSENAVQVRLSRHKTEFSTLANDMSSLDDSGIESLADSISEKNEKFAAVKSDGRKYIRSVHNLTDAAGDYVSVQYFTVMDGYIYNFSVYSSNGGTADAEKIFSSLKLYSDDENGKISIGWTLLFAAVVAVLTTVFVIVLVGLIKNMRKKPSEESEDIEKNA